MSDTDEQLVLRIQKGDTEPLGLLIDRYEAKIKRYISRFVGRPDEVQDITQDVFIKVYENIQSFDADRKFSSWIYRIAHNECLNYIKKKRPLLFDIDLDIIFPHKNISPSLFDEYSTGENRELLTSVMEELDYKHKEILVLYFFEDLSYKEISDILKIPISSVGVRILRAKQKVEQLLKQNGMQKNDYGN